MAVTEIVVSGSITTNTAIQPAVGVTYTFKRGFVTCTSSNSGDLFSLDMGNRNFIANSSMSPGDEFKYFTFSEAGWSASTGSSSYATGAGGNPFAALINATPVSIDTSDAVSYALVGISIT